MTVTDIKCYDVLVDPPMDGVAGEYQLDDYKQNIGNNRLQVFLALYQSNYERECRRQNNAGCNSIVNDVLETYNRRCVPSGRFLMKGNNESSNNLSSENYPNTNRDGPDRRSINDDEVFKDRNVDGPTHPDVWNIMNENEAKELLHAILRGVPPPKRYKQWRHHQQKQQQQRAGELQTNNNDQTDKNSIDQEERKRRHSRSSLLRRSASDTLLEDSKKVTKLFDREHQQQIHLEGKEELTWTSSPSNSTVSLNRMDVILASSMDALDPSRQSIGNNRLQILVAMQSGKYQQTTPEARETILDEVVQTVNAFWKGRFLIEVSDGYYQILDKSDAKRSLRLIFDIRSGQDLFPSANATATVSNVGNGLNRRNIRRSSQSAHRVGESMPNGFERKSIKVMRHASMSAIPTGNAGMIPTDTKHKLKRHSTPLLPAPLRHISSSVDILDPLVGLSGIEDLRAAAVKSLQRQKRRQKIANKLEKVSMMRNRNFRNDSNISINTSTNNNSVSTMRSSNFSNNSNANSFDSNLNISYNNFPENQSYTDNYDSNTGNRSFNIGVHNNINNVNQTSLSSSFSIGRRETFARKRQSPTFGALDPSIMDEIVTSCFDDDDLVNR